MDIRAGQAALKSVARSVRGLSAVPSRAARAAASEIADRIQEQFDGGVDAYGRPWATLRPSTLAKGRTPPPLTDSASMRDGIQVKPARGAGITIVIGEPYASFHQVGTRNMVARPILPTHGFPDTWRRAVADACETAFGDIMGAV